MDNHFDGTVPDVGSRSPKNRAAPLRFSPPLSCSNDATTIVDLAAPMKDFSTGCEFSGLQSPPASFSSQNQSFQLNKTKSYASSYIQPESIGFGEEMKQEDYLSDDLQIRIPLKDLSSALLSPQCRSFLKKLFDPRPWKRCSSWHSFEALMQHEWFVSQQISADTIKAQKIYPKFASKDTFDDVYKISKMIVRSPSFSMMQTMQLPGSQKDVTFKKYLSDKGSSWKKTHDDFVDFYFVCESYKDIFA
jgi:hypothetical protein